MSSLYTHQTDNVRKTWLLMSLFFILIVGIGYFFSTLYNNSGIVIVAVIISVGMNIASYWYSDSIALNVSGAKSLAPADNLELYRLVENLCITAGLPMPRLYIIHDASPNAFATGRDKHHAAIAVTTGLLETLNRSELEGVIAHELAHIGNRDILLMTVVVVLAGCIALLSDMFLRSLMWGNHRSDDRDNRIQVLMIVIGIALSLITPLVATIIQLAVSRKREFLADATGALLTRYPEGLASALEKISSDRHQLKNANKATAHLFISSPFKGKSARSFFTHLFMTHPPVEERIAALLGRKKE